MEENKKNQIYPNIHADNGEREDDNMMEELYGAPSMMYEHPVSEVRFVTRDEEKKRDEYKFCGRCGKQLGSSRGFCGSCGFPIGTEDKEPTVQFCNNCSRDNLMINRYCVYCGKLIRTVEYPGESWTNMGVVYASPEIMCKKQFILPEKKESFFKRLFKRKNK